MSNELTIDFVSIVTRSLIMRYKIEREKARKELEEKYKKRVIFAHELLLCPLKLEFKEKLSEIELLTSFKPSILVGEIVEQGVREYLERLGFIKADYVCIKEFDDFILAGSPDYCTNDRSKIVDIKFSKLPLIKEHHYKRLAVYLNICNSKEGYLLYISPRGIISEKLTAPMTDDEIIDLINTSRAPRFSWECRYCQFSEFCRIGPK